MGFCTACGHELGVVRFCTHCGSPVAAGADDISTDTSTDTAERPDIRAAPPARATQPMTPPARPPAHRRDDSVGGHPQSADQPAGGFETAERPASGSWPTETDVPSWAPSEGRGRTIWPVFVAVGFVLVLIMVIGIWLLGGRDDEPESASPTPADTAADNPADNTSNPSASASESGRSAELARTASASVPVTAPPGQDISGNIVPYTADNMLDGVPSTTWRMPGDGTGQTLTFTLDAESVLTEVGLINGYAKIDRTGNGPPANWYLRNRRVTEVEWGFDDGTKVTQALVQSDSMQTLPIQPEETKTVTLTLLSVSAPGARDGRNYTPISDVTLVGG